jgi:transcriptional regulator with XRE-family HTH domain
MSVESLGQRIRRERQARGWTQYELAAEVGVKRFTVTRWESGEIPETPLFFRLAHVLEIPAGYLWEGDPR